ncbi:hypothetical protein Ahy_B06g084354 [Arachis hypogaea]|uniref:Uncharacterized protein n=1 Tax=Arachis hypogaea TaxID=3818 RepID=A0A444YRN6_ARAHY|nr:hypothetical protein Ahy_B06g084354 [Arachis hypogaea]
MGNRVFQFRLFCLQGDKHARLIFDIHGRIMAEQVMERSAEVGDVGGGGSGSLDFVQDNPPLAPKPLHIASLVEDMDVDSEDSDEEYVADSNESGFSEDDEKEEFVPKTPVEASRRHYTTLDMDTMQKKNPFSNLGEDDYNLNGGVEFRVSHRFKNKDSVIQGVKNYSICRSDEYRVVESDRLKYHVRCQQHEAGAEVAASPIEFLFRNDV